MITGRLQGGLKKVFFVKPRYKLTVVIFVFCLIFIHLLAMVISPHSLMAGQIFLIIILSFMMYLWIQELKDRQVLEKAEVDTIATLILTAEAKDIYTSGHSKRVALYSTAIAEEIGLTEEEQKIIKRAATLHDLGKIGINDNILRKGSELSKEEWDIMKDHPRKAVEILKPLKFLTRERGIIQHHHERCDGNGYPDGLKGTMIPLGSRIVAVADAFDAMNSVRAYRNALSKQTIVSELRKASGSQLSEDVVNVFLKLLEEKPEFWDLS